MTSGKVENTVNGGWMNSNNGHTTFIVSSLSIRMQKIQMHQIGNQKQQNHRKQTETTYEQQEADKSQEADEAER